jgi:hypothetical protein
MAKKKPVRKAPAKPKVPILSSYLKADTTYQQQIAQLRKAYSQYAASQQNEKTNYNNSYALNKRTLNTERTRGLTDTTDDFASRGMLRSGVYGKTYADKGADYSQRQAALDTEKTSFLSDLGVNLKTYQGDQATTKTSALQEAIARRAAKYRLSL